MIQKPASCSCRKPVLNHTIKELRSIFYYLLVLYLLPYHLILVIHLEIRAAAGASA